MCLAIPIQITCILPDEQAEGAQLGVHIQFSTAGVDNPQIGDYVLVHAGIAIQKLDEADADQTLALLGGQAALIGEVTEDHTGKLVLNTTMNTLRTLGVLTSDPLPRIC